MEFTQKHADLVDQFKEIQKLHYTVHETDECKYVPFMADVMNFFRLDLLLFELEGKIKQYPFLSNVQRSVGLNCAAEKLDLTVGQFFDDEDKNFLIGRLFDASSGNKVVKHQTFHLPLEARGKGFAKKFLCLCFEKYIEIDIREVTLKAVDIGAHTWGKFGFMAVNRNQVDSILAKVVEKYHAGQIPEEEYDFIMSIYTSHYEAENSLDFPMNVWSLQPSMEEILKSSTWDARFNLADPMQKRIFDNYVLGN